MINFQLNDQTIFFKNNKKFNFHELIVYLGSIKLKISVCLREPFCKRYPQKGEKTVGPHQTEDRFLEC